MFATRSKCFSNLISERIYQIRYEIFNSDPEYRELSLAVAELLDRLLDRLASCWKSMIANSWTKPAARMSSFTAGG